MLELKFQFLIGIINREKLNHEELAEDSFNSS